MNSFKFPDLPTTASLASKRKPADIERDARTMTKAEIADALFEHLGLNKREAKDMVDGFFEEICQALERGEAVKLSGFGNFQLRDKPTRLGRNPKTGEGVRPLGGHVRQPLRHLLWAVDGHLCHPGARGRARRAGFVEEAAGAGGGGGRGEGWEPGAGEGTLPGRGKGPGEEEGPREGGGATHRGVRGRFPGAARQLRQ